MPPPTTNTTTNTTGSSLRTSFVRWLEAADGRGSTAGPTDELLAEHHVMEAVLAAMEAEAEGMLAGRPLRPEFWRDVVDFNGNFVHLCHRAKEEEHLVTSLVAHGRLDGKREQAIRQEHGSGKDLTLALIEGAAEADWEKVLRLVSIYVHIMRPHMRREESGIFAAAAELPAGALAQLRREFAAVDQKALGSGGRRRFVDVARRLATMAGVGHDLDLA